jgi:hypothetical protein
MNLGLKTAARLVLSPYHFFKSTERSDSDFLTPDT